MGQSFTEYCTQNGREDLLAQWDRTKNEDHDPARISYSAHVYAWWRCEKGHSWRARVNARVQGTGCPVCANRVILPGVNDLGTTHPDLAAQWHPTRNGGLSPQMVVAGSRRKVWWQCENGHEWQASILSRVGGSGCPVEAGKLVLPGENDLATAYPEIAAQWDGEKNGNLTPQRVSPYSNRTAWWRCDRGHSYQAAVAHRTSASSDCPYCTGRRVLPGFNDLKSQQPEVAAQWHPTLNGALRPDMVTCGSRKKVWWECAYGHVWKAVINSRTGKDQCGCPACAGKVHYARRRCYAQLEAEAAARKALGEPTGRGNLLEILEKIDWADCM